VTPARRALVCRLAIRVAVFAAVVALDELGARALAAWDAGDRLLAGGASRLEGGLLLGAFLLFRLAVFFALPPAAVIMVARAIDDASKKASPRTLSP
jgi:ABC-type uncharacterized transport system YnjBCD permease subunit